MGLVNNRRLIYIMYVNLCTFVLTCVVTFPSVYDLLCYYFNRHKLLVFLAINCL